MSAAVRLRREHKGLLSSPPPGVSLQTLDAGSKEWIVNIDGAEASLYQGETFNLRFRFDERYPFESPEVTFIGTPPMHVSHRFVFRFPRLR